MVVSLSPLPALQTFLFQCIFLKDFLSLACASSGHSARGTRRPRCLSEAALPRLQSSEQPELSLDLSPSDEAVSLLSCQKSGFPSFHFFLVLPQFVLFPCRALLAAQGEVLLKRLSVVTGPMEWFGFASVTIQQQKSFNHFQGVLDPCSWCFLPCRDI